jgi:hypothetical protein
VRERRQPVAVARGHRRRELVVRAAVRALDPELPVFDTRSLAERLDQSLGAAASRRG